VNSGVEPGPETCWVWRTTRCITGTVVLDVGSVVVIGVLLVVVVLFVVVATLVLVTCRTVVVGREAAPEVLTVPVGVPGRDRGPADVVGRPVVAPPRPPGNVGPDELAAALEREWTGR